MLIEVKVPPLPESVSDATLSQWAKQPGQAVRRDEHLVDLETDKVVLDIAAPQDGVLAEIKFGNGTVVKRDQVIALIDTSAPSALTAQAPQEPASAFSSAPASAAAPAQQHDLSPAVRRMVAEHDLDAEKIPATGRGGRVTKEDVVRHLEQPVSAPQAEARPQVAATAAMPAGRRPEQRVPMTRLRARIAERLVEAQHNAAMLTTFNEVDMSAVMDLRQRYQEPFQKKHGVKLGFMSLFIKASCAALRQFPGVNGSIDGDDIVYHGYYDVGVAVSTPRGLVVPIIRDADQRTLADIEKTVADYGARARDGKLGMEELSGGTFTITNGGVFGSLLSTPILNPPQSAILGMHKIQERPVALDGQVAIRPMMYLALSYDHRIIDGQEAVRFLVTLKDALEDPARLLLDL